ncbi:hypothetical protein BX616_006437 [Lobosporangium transversale]|uniref:RNAse P Rpr2/Rpp21/SNM1 subunit domain-domain-containing protein n=1 Tax=Lobosporangium transversale TaxID=64571 RepID=A0A1Y2H6A1_9FUNG|nr:hypothetical protein BCR41DRAFT_343753 [Lobosporangium transversale]KAF9915319.1 hypothetical protein BX616_006437 [Lobosporangium transversale]ORZ28592.1 hypothetical protein BCR41DRAFT_343753 [Lobosporangium transversale]|eukprot:XP_021886265.1 hypothetical protein BCR41DRAFT_343753 [Lobosporangium transversale]
MADAYARLDFLWKASYTLLSTCPGASSHYMAQFLDLANARDLKLHEDIQTKSCAACGSIFVPGINTKVRVVPVHETRIERERRKKQARKRAKKQNMLLKSKDNDESFLGADKLATTRTTVSTAKEETMNYHQTTATMEYDEGKETKKSINVNLATITATTKVLPTSNPQKQSSTQPQQLLRPRKIIRITPHTEIIQQQQQMQQQLRRQLMADGKPSRKIDKRANQVLNHIIYSCQRCNRDTELRGTKEGYLTSHIKAKKLGSQRRKLKNMKQDLASTSAEAAIDSKSQPIQPVPSTLKSGPNLVTHATAVGKRSASPLPTHIQPNTKQFKNATSLPPSPIRGLSKASSAASSAASSPVSSPRLDNAKSGGSSGSSSKKKKKGGLASILASQKAKDPPPDPNDGAGSSGDSSLANFLMGL